jgi:tyrosinase
MATKRKSAFAMSKAEQDVYKNAVTTMISGGTYTTLVSIHKDMSHNMHDMGTLVSRLRFLSWHRAYLIHFEAELQKVDKTAFVPYWKWVDGGVPSWLASFTPTVDKIPNNRNNLTSPITTQARIDVVLKSPDYPTFTHELEIDPHNQGHVALGKPMSQVPTAPSDPIFWMHHGEVDRVWSLWQTANPGKGPLLSGTDAVMDPWTEDVKALSSIASLGYSYV